MKRLTMVGSVGLFFALACTGTVEVDEEKDDKVEEVEEKSLEENRVRRSRVAAKVGVLEEEWSVTALKWVTTTM